MRYRDVIAARAAPAATSSRACRLLAAVVAELAEAAAARGLAGPPHAVRPLYVRRPDAELARERAETAGAPDA